MSLRTLTSVHRRSTRHGTTHTRSSLASQYRRRIPIPRQRQSDMLFERYKDLVQPLMDFIGTRGRLPEEVELHEAPALRVLFESMPLAHRIIRQVPGEEQWDRSAKNVWKISGLFSAGAVPRRPFLVLPRDLQRDVKAFFGTYTRACEMADRLLFSVGNLAAIDAACKAATCGKLTPEALYVHLTGLPHLPSILRIYEGCARGFIGLVEGAKIVKLHRRIPQVSYLSYPEFDRIRIPRWLVP